MKQGLGESPKDNIKETVILQSHQNYSEEPTGRDMPFVLRHHGYQTMTSIGKDGRKSEPPHTSPVGI